MKIINRQRKFKLLQIFMPFISCFSAGLISFLAIIASRFYSTETTSVDYFQCLVVAFSIIASLIFVAFVELLKNYRLSLSNILQISFCVGFIIVALNIIFQFAHLLAYGDAGYLSDVIIVKNTVFPRWFLGSAVLNRIYQSLWPTIGSHLPGTLTTADGFVLLAGAAFMALSSIILLRKFGACLMILVPLLTPMWLVFSTGYNEYYPFIAGLYLAVLSCLYKGVGNYTPISIAGYVSVILLCYAGFVPLGLLVLLYYCLFANLSDSLKAVVLTGVISLSIIVLLWPSTLYDFFIQYKHTLNLGELNIPTEYAGTSSSPQSPFFKVSYALSLRHIKEVLFILFWGGALFPTIIFLLAVRYSIKQGIVGSFLKSREMICLVVYFAFQIFYVFFLIPKLGPVQDIDLFFTFHLIVGFLGGILGDKVLVKVSTYWRDKIQSCVVGALSGSSAVMLVYILTIGIEHPSIL